MQSTTENTRTSPSVLASLRALAAPGAKRFPDALRIAERQAAALRAATDQTAGAFDEAALARLPRIRIERRRLPVSGLSYWNGECWVVNINEDEPAGRQRLTLLHEYKHIVDHGRQHDLYRGRHLSIEQESERAADFFAGCALMPADEVRDALASGRSIADLATHFQVTVRAMEVRIGQLGLREKPRCARPVRSTRASQHFRIQHKERPGVRPTD